MEHGFGTIDARIPYARGISGLGFRVSDCGFGQISDNLRVWGLGFTVFGVLRFKGFRA